MRGAGAVQFSQLPYLCRRVRLPLIFIKDLGNKEQKGERKEKRIHLKATQR